MKQQKIIKRTEFISKRNNYKRMQTFELECGNVAGPYVAGRYDSKDKWFCSCKECR